MAIVTEGTAGWLATGLENRGAVTRRRSTRLPSAMDYMLMDFVTGNAIGIRIDSLEEGLKLLRTEMVDPESLILIESDDHGMTTRSWLYEDAV